MFSDYINLINRQRDFSGGERAAVLQQGALRDAAGGGRPAHGLVQVLPRKEAASRLGHPSGAGRVQGLCSNIQQCTFQLQ